MALLLKYFARVHIWVYRAEPTADSHLHPVARDATDAERDRYRPPLIRMYALYRRYREAPRIIPLVVC